MAKKLETDRSCSVRGSEAVAAARISTALVLPAVEESFRVVVSRELGSIISI